MVKDKLVLKMDPWWIESILEGVAAPKTLYRSNVQTGNVGQPRNQVDNKLEPNRGLSEAGQELIDYLYSFPHAETHSFLEPFIVEFDSVMDRDDLVRALGQRIGLWIPVGRSETAADIFIDKMMAVIKSLGPLVHEESPTLPGGYPSVPYVVNMTADQFHQWLVQREGGFPDKTNLTVEEESVLFQDRLYLLARTIAS